MVLSTSAVYDAVITTDNTKYIYQDREYTLYRIYNIFILS